MTTEYLQTFKAPTLQEAYRKMRKALGDDAIVLRAAETKEGGIFGIFAKTVFTVTAAVPPKSLRKTPATKQASSVERRYNHAPGNASLAPIATNKIGSQENVQQTVAYFQKIVEDAQQRVKSSETRALPTEHTSSANVSAGASQQQPIEPKLQKELTELRQMMSVLVAEKPGAALPVELVPHFRALLASGFDQRMAAHVVDAACKGLEPGLLRDSRLVHDRLRQLIRNQMSVREGLVLKQGRCTVVAAIGPTGVGKTTSLAKLAAHFAVRQRVSVALITADTYRVAAPEQLRVYAKIIGLPMDVVNTPAEMAYAVSKHRGRDLILIDTAGSSQFNLRQISELQELLAVASPDDVMLMLAANTQPEELRNSAIAFKDIGPTSVFFTKLDETKRYGVMYSVLAGLRLPLCYVSFGQNVPDDFMPANAGKLADLYWKAGIIMVDQAQNLREIVRENRRRAHVIAVTSGKGGVGKTSTSVNLAIALAQRGKRVVLLDGDLGLANVEVLLGLNSLYNLQHVISGEKKLPEVLAQAPGGIMVVPGSSGLARIADLGPVARANILNGLEELQDMTDFIIIDTMAGIGQNAVAFCVAADEVILVCTPEPSSIVDAYAMLKTVYQMRDDATVNLVVNMAASEEQALAVATKFGNVAQQFLVRSVPCLGYIVRDSHVSQAVMQTHPFLLRFPNAPATRCVHELAGKVIFRRVGIDVHRPGFFRRFAQSLGIASNG